MQIDCERCLTTNHLLVQDFDFCFECIACDNIQWISEEYASTYRILNSKTWKEAEKDLIGRQITCAYNEGFI